MSDNKIYGECEIDDCPADGSFCKPTDKYGMGIAASVKRAKAPHIRSTSALPPGKCDGISAWGGIQRMYRNEFIGFETSTRTGNLQSVLGLNGAMSDYIPMAEFYDTKVTDAQSFLYLMPPS
jgi:hypothetical protein